MRNRFRRKIYLLVFGGGRTITHVLLIPKQPIATLNDLTAADATVIGKLFLAATSWAKAQGFADNGYRCVMNCNKDGGQTVYHIHLHLLAGRQMHWPPG